VGNQDFPRRVNRQGACVEQETSHQEEVRDNGVNFRGGGSLLFLFPKGLPDIRPFQRTGAWLEIPSGPGEAFGFKFFMHVTYYLMIAALTLIGFEVIYALYQLASFVL
jgi:hypothetical protein